MCYSVHIGYFVEVMMGKKTLYHPVSLYAIRASLAMYGYKAGVIRQLISNPNAEWAQYTVTLIDPPVAFKSLNQFDQMDTLNNCFADDVQVFWAGLNMQGVYCCNIRTRVIHDRQETGDLDWPASQREG